MFFDNENIQDKDIKLIFSIIDGLPIEDAINRLSANKQLHKIIENKQFWMRRFGVEDYASLIMRYNQLNDYPEIHALFKTGYVNLSQKSFDEMLRLLTLSEDGRCHDILKAEGYKIESDDSGELTITDPRFEKMDISMQEAVDDTLKQLVSDRGILALQLGLITLKSAFKPEICGEVPMYLTKNGIVSLIDGSVKLGQLNGLRAKYTEDFLNAISMNSNFIGSSITSNQLNSLMCRNGISALDEGLITLFQAATLKHEMIDILMTDSGLAALRKNLIPIDKLYILNENELKELISGKDITELRNENESNSLKTDRGPSKPLLL